MKRLRQINFLSVVITLLLVNCTRPKDVSQTDYEQLYGVWYDNAYKDSLAQVLKPAVHRALKLPNSKHNRVIIDSVLHELRWTRDSVSFFKLSDKAIDFAQAKSDPYLLANAYNDIGMYYQDLGVLDSTFYYYIKAENIYKELNDSIRMGEMEFYQARVLFEKGLHMESEVKVSNALHILRNEPLNPVPFEANSLMALCLIERKDYAAAKGYFLKGLTLMKQDFNKNIVLEQDQLKLAMAMLYLNLSDVAYLLKDYNLSLKYATEGLTYVSSGTTSLLKVVLEANIDANKLMLNVGNKVSIGNDLYLKGVISGYDEAIKVNNMIYANHQAMMIAELNLAMQDTVKAFSWADISYGISKERKILIDQRTALEFMLRHSVIKDSKQVDEVIDLSHEIEGLDYLTRNRFARIAYETEKIAIENDELKSLVFMLVIASLTIILGLSIGVFFYRLRMKDKKLYLVKQQQKAEESIYQLILEKNSIESKTKKAVYNKIAKDIHDGVVNGIFTVRFNLQQLETTNEDFKRKLIVELESLEKSTRGISHDLINNELFKEVKFCNLIEELVSLQKNKWKTKFAFKKVEQLDLEYLSAVEKVNIYYIIREALQNVNKYSQASHCTVSIVMDSNRVMVSIKDDGVGFDVEKESEGLGIENMKERATFLKSRLNIISKRGSGVQIFFEIKQ